jgi:hypothetical protein
MTTIVGIFDDAWNVEKAIEQLAAAGFEDTVFDEAILTEQPERRCYPVSGAGLCCEKRFCARTAPI